LSELWGVVDSYSTLGHMGGGNRYGRYALLRVVTTHSNGDLVYISQCGRYHAKGCMAVG
jgi:hypothetical protein